MGYAARQNPRAQAAKRGEFKCGLPPIGYQQQLDREAAERRARGGFTDPAELAIAALLSARLSARKRSW